LGYFLILASLVLVAVAMRVCGQPDHFTEQRVMAALTAGALFAWPLFAWRPGNSMPAWN